MNKRKAGISVGTAVFALAVLLATMTFPQMAFPQTEEGGIKQDACGALGCPDETDLECATGEIEVSTPVISGKISITCYEPER